MSATAAATVGGPVSTVWRRIPGAWRQPLTVIGIVLVTCWLVIALLAPWISPYDPLAQSAGLYRPPSGAHLLGTDELGRDVFSRVLWGARISIPLAILLVGLAFTIGGVLGGLAGYLGGWVDELVMRAADFVFAVPTILLAMAVVAALGPGLFHAVLAVVLVSWPGHARVMRGLVRTTMQSEYVAVGRLLGSPTYRALAIDVLPNVAGPISSWPRSRPAMRFCSSARCRSWAWGRAHRPRSGGRWSPPAPSTSRPGGSASFQGWRS